jgi:hypothetical protein
VSLNVDRLPASDRRGELKFGLAALHDELGVPPLSQRAQDILRQHRLHKRVKLKSADGDKREHRGK